jgi:hypothetical protein
MNHSPRKRRTRGHIIADLSINYLERFVLRCGHVLQRVIHDYGIDLLMHTFDANGEVQNGEVRFQVKATEQLKRLANRPIIPWRLKQSDLRHWLNEPMPVILVVYEAQADRAYWLYLQQYFEGHRRVRLTENGKTISVSVPEPNRLDEGAIREFARLRDYELHRLQGGRGQS